MRFPLIVMVLFIHVLPDRYEHVSIPTSSYGLYVFVSELFSHNICNIAVPLFFVISGYLYFANAPIAKTKQFWVEKYKRRVWSLVLPYFLWNVLLLIAIIIKDAIFYRLGFGHDEGIDMIRNLKFYGVIWGMPINFPLWFLRDLICVTLLAPLFFYLNNKIGIVCVGFLYLLYLIGVESNVAGLSSTSVFYYCLGCYLGDRRFDCYSYVQRCDWHVFVPTIILLMLGVLLNDSNYHALLIRLFIPFGILSFSRIICMFVDKRFGKRLISLSGVVFFIYAVHEVFIIRWVKGFILRVFGDDLLGLWMAYLLVPIITLYVCILLYRLISSISPKAVAVMCGGRIYQM